MVGRPFWIGFLCSDLSPEHLSPRCVWGTVSSLEGLPLPLGVFVVWEMLD